MNAKQAARAAAKHIEALEEEIRQLEYINNECRLDIRAYNGCIESMIKHGSPCEWCNDQIECQREEKTAGQGCEEWMLAFREHVDQDQSGKGDTDDSTGIFSAGTAGGE